MTSRVNRHLQLNKSGRKVKVKGPISNWETDEHCAVFSVVIAQVAADGTLVTAHGTSTGMRRPPNTAWAAEAVVTEAGAQLTAGPATAAATATIQVDGPAIETYTWSLVTQLEL